MAEGKIVVAVVAAITSRLDIAAGSKLIALANAENWLGSSVYVCIVSETLPFVPTVAVDPGMSGAPANGPLDGAGPVMYTVLPLLIVATANPVEGTSLASAAFEGATTILYVVAAPAISKTLSCCGRALGAAGDDAAEGTSLALAASEGATTILYVVAAPAISETVSLCARAAGDDVASGSAGCAVVVVPWSA